MSYPTGRSERDLDEKATPRRRRTVAALIAGSLVLALCLYIGVLDIRTEQIPLRLPTDQPGDTWVLVGSDTRAGLDTDAGYLVGKGVPEGSRADIIMVVHRTSGSSRVLQIPRDLIVSDDAGWPVRLALTLDSGPQVLVDAICTELGIAADHLLVVDLAGFMRVVDSLGGIDVTIPSVVRDPAAGLDLPAGRQTLDGDQALALVRSRKTEEKRGGRWTRAGTGAEHRMNAGSMVFESVGARMAGSWRRPLRALRSSWTASSSISLDSGSHIWDLWRLRSIDDTEVLRSDPLGDGWARTAAPGSAAQLRHVGAQKRCEVRD